MQPPLPKCLLLPLDESLDFLAAVPFLNSLYADKRSINLILAYFTPPLPEVYREKKLSQAMAEKKEQAEQSREEKARAVFDEARRLLVADGFVDDMIQESTEEKQLSQAHHACRLADVKKVDAVVVHHWVGSRLESFLRTDPTDGLLNHCILSPVWFVGNEIDPSRAAICIQEGNESLRAADHAAFMLAETGTRLELFCPAPKARNTIVSPAYQPTAELEEWLAGKEGKPIKNTLREAMDIVKEAGVEDDRVTVTVLPSQGHVATDLVRHCQQEKIGIVVLGHSEPQGMLGFMKSSLTKQVLPEIQHVAVWVQH